jgi:hypothetical protein
VAVGDVNGDGVDDVITGATTGHVEVFDGGTGVLLQSFFAFPGYGGDIVVAAGDVNHDGHADIIVGAAAGSAGGHIKVFDGADGSLLQSFYAFPGYMGPITVAAGDVNGDGKADIIVGASGTLGEHVKAFSGADGSLLLSFYSLPNFSGQISLAAGSLTGGAAADIIVGSGSGSTGARVNVFSGADGSAVENFTPFPGFIGAVRVAARDLNGDGKADIIVGVGPGAPNGHVKAFDGSSLVVFESFLAFPNFSGGVFVG